MSTSSTGAALRGASRRIGLALSSCSFGLALGLALVFAPTAAWAGPRDDMRQAYAEALRLFNDLELDAAIEVIDSAIGEAESSAASNDPVLASLYLMKAALLYSNAGEEASADIIAAMESAVRLNYFVVMPLEVRSEGLTNFLNEARDNVGEAPNEPIGHTAPETECGEDIQVEALLTVPDGGQAAVYWRPRGTSEYLSLGMNVFSNVAEATIGYDEHGDADLEYFIYAFDAGDEPVANLGTEDAPLALELGCIDAEPEPVVAPEMKTGPSLEEQVKKKRQGSAGGLPKFAFNIGIGTGAGLAKGSVEQTWEQYFPQAAGVDYTWAQHACAIARFNAAPNGELPSAAQLHGGTPNNPAANSIFGTFAPEGSAATVAQAYNASDCARRHEVQTGMAWAPLAIAPEIQFRLAKKITLSIFGRLQVMTGSKVYRDNNTISASPAAPPDQSSYWLYAYTATPPKDFQVKTPFTWAAGLKVRYYLGQEEAKLRPFAGGFAGYGQSRVRVNMGFANDINGNSVPDDHDVAYDLMSSDQSVCVQVWPYNQACNTSNPDFQTEFDMAQTLRANAQADFSSGKNVRIDTIVMGPVFAGATFGVHYQLVKNFAVFAEVHAGGWFGGNSSVLFDLNLGPVLTF